MGGAQAAMMAAALPMGMAHVARDSLASPHVRRSFNRLRDSFDGYDGYEGLGGFEHGARASSSFAPPSASPHRVDSLVSLSLPSHAPQPHAYSLPPSRDRSLYSLNFETCLRGG